jgi:Domain of unknown function (DUF4350)
VTGNARRRVGAKTILTLLGAVVVLVALLTPEAPVGNNGQRTSYSTGPAGVRMAFELASRMGWRTERRIVPMDSIAATPTVQVVLEPNEALGAHEVHRLLDNVRRGGGLVFAIDGADEIADSLGLDLGRPGRFLSTYGDAACKTPASFRDRTLLALPPEVNQIVWRRPAPGPTTILARTHEGIQKTFTVGVGFPLGSGRIAAISSPGLFANDAVRLCGTGADIVVANAFEFVRPPGAAAPRMVFDEYHHGFGMHGGSMTAIAGYLSGTSSGRFLTQALIAGLLLVLARAPRPLPPEDPARVVRRSPLEHADALGHAYADVRATRTATARLVSGVRRRNGRTIAKPAGLASDDAAFLDAVEQRHPALHDAVARVRHALAEPVSPRELVAVGQALNDIERRMAAPPSLRS